MDVKGKLENQSLAYTAVRLNRTQNPSKLLFHIPLVTALATLSLLMLAVANGWLGKGAHVGGRFGEVSRAGLIKQPVNTFSSLGFVFTGLFIGWCLKREAARHNTSTPAHETPFHVFFASLVVCLGPGSMAMHATETTLGGRLDLLSMYLVAAFLAVYAIWRFFPMPRAWFVFLFALVVALCFDVQDLHFPVPLMHNFGEFIFGLLIAVGALFEALNSFVRKSHQDFKWAALSLSLLLFAFLIWNLALSKTPSRSLLQGHALWHLLCAGAAYCLFRYYASRRGRVGSKIGGDFRPQPCPAVYPSRQPLETS